MTINFFIKSNKNSLLATLTLLKTYFSHFYPGYNPTGIIIENKIETCRRFFGNKLNWASCFFSFKMEIPS